MKCSYKFQHLSVIGSKKLKANEHNLIFSKAPFLDITNATVPV